MCREDWLNSETIQPALHTRCINALSVKPIHGGCDRLGSGAGSRNDCGIPRLEHINPQLVLSQVRQIEEQAEPADDVSQFGILKLRKFGDQSRFCFGKSGSTLYGQTADSLHGVGQRFSDLLADHEVQQLDKPVECPVCMLMAHHSFQFATNQNCCLTFRVEDARLENS